MKAPHLYLFYKGFLSLAGAPQTVQGSRERALRKSDPAGRLNKMSKRTDGMHRGCGCYKVNTVGPIGSDSGRYRLLQSDMCYEGNKAGAGLWGAQRGVGAIRDRWSGKVSGEPDKG